MVNINSETQPIKQIFSKKYSVDYFQREYVWEEKQLSDLIMDLSNEFMKNWKPGHELSKIKTYDPYFMGEIVLSVKDGTNYIIDGQQRITTITLLLMYLLNKFAYLKDFPDSDVKNLIFNNYLGTYTFNLDIPERQKCMHALLENNEYIIDESDSISVINIVNRYNDIDECWIKDKDNNDLIDENNVVAFTYWLIEQVLFSEVKTDSDEFAYVIFETMNDRGLSLTQVEMLRSYLLANIDEKDRTNSMNTYDFLVKRLMSIKLSSKSKAEFEFFKVYLRGHYAETLLEKGMDSDFSRIGKEFHRWVRDNEKILGLNKSDSFIEFINKLDYFSKVYENIYSRIEKRDYKDFYLVVNSDYGFTLQSALILSSIRYKDDSDTINKKIEIISKYITKLLTWRVWNHWVISQSMLDGPVYEFCKKIRDRDLDSLQLEIDNCKIPMPELEGTPVLNHQNRNKIIVLLSLITAIVGEKSGEPQYPLNSDQKQEIEHIWANHYLEHTEFASESEFQQTRNNIGDLLILPKSFNASYGDKDYSIKIEQYFSQNILAQSLNDKKYVNNPGFVKYKNESGLAFKPYSIFSKDSISERAELYRQILLNNWK